MENILHPNRPVRCIITGPSECGKRVFLTNLILKLLTSSIKYISTHLVFICNICIKN